VIGVAEVMELIFPQTGRELTGIFVVEEKATLSCQNQRKCFEPITTQSVYQGLETTESWNLCLFLFITSRTDKEIWNLCLS